MLEFCGICRTYEPTASHKPTKHSGSIVHRKEVLLWSVPSFQKHPCGLQVTANHRQQQRRGIVARPLFSAAYFEVCVGPRSNKHADDLRLPVHGSTEQKESRCCAGNCVGTRYIRNSKHTYTKHNTDEGLKLGDGDVRSSMSKVIHLADSGIGLARLLSVFVRPIYSGRHVA